MGETAFLTAEEVVERYRGQLTAGTLANWRVKRIGPDFVKIGKAVLYPLAALEAWDAQNRVACRRPKGQERATVRGAANGAPRPTPLSSPSWESLPAISQAGAPT
jgi:hypothetical protein